MQKVLWISLAIVVFGATAAFWSLKPLLTYKPMLPKGVARGTTREELSKIIADVREEKSPRPREQSKAIAPEPKFDFGMMDPHGEMSHTFVIRNEGLDTLRLGDPRSMCHCAEATLSSYEIPAAGQGSVTMTWTPENAIGHFGVSVIVPTSDPQNEELVLSVEGIVRQRLDAEPRALFFGDILPDAPAPSQETLIYSHVWESFEIVQKTSSLQGAKLTLRPATPQQLAQRQAKAGWVLAVTLPENLPTGALQESVEVVVQPADQSVEPQHYTLSLSGQMRGRLSIHGTVFDENGVLDLGLVQRGVAKRTRLLVKVRDSQKSLGQTRLEVEPSFVHVTLTPQSASPGGAGIYTMDIVIPDDAPPCAHLRPDQYGLIRLTTDHPRIPSRELKLRFAVAGREAGELAP